MDQQCKAADAHLSIMDLPSVLMSLYERAQTPLLPTARGPIGLFVRYLRRKPERGLAVIYAVDEIHSSHHARTNDPHRSVSLTLDELALDGVRIRFNATEIKHGIPAIQTSGVLHVRDFGISVQKFPADAHLPALAASCDTTPQSTLFTALQQAARTLLEDPAWTLLSATAIPVRYKPASRCVIRYQLLLAHTTKNIQRTLSIFGKLYADPEQACSVQSLQQQLYEEQVDNLPLLPRPLATINALGLTLNEAVEAQATDAQKTVWDTLRTGTQALRPQLERGRGGTVTKLLIPEEELRLTAQALARLHNSALQPNKAAPRTGSKEAKRARERATLIASRHPSQADEILYLANELATRLEHLQPDSYRPAHGGFKASQLLFSCHRVFVVDFDGFCLADPALDVGYFLAYLRPSGLWYHRPGMRQWFEEAAQVFRTTYYQTMLTFGISATDVDAILARTQFYEAALLFKIATRRVNRLNSPRPQELAAMLNEIKECLVNQ